MKLGGNTKLWLSSLMGRELFDFQNCIAAMKKRVRILMTAKRVRTVKADMDRERKCISEPMG